MTKQRQCFFGDEKDYQFGELSFDDWDGYWKANATDPDAKGGEYELYFRELDLALRARCPNYPDDFYVRGDFFGDRSQDVEIVNPHVLTMALLEHLQNYLASHGERMWRMRIPTYLAKNEVIVVYPSAICFPNIYRTGGDAEKSLKLIRGAMQKMIDMGKRTRSPPPRPTT